jgi:hypothetical protein
MIVKIPKIVPKGLNKQRKQAVIKENQYLLCLLSERPEIIAAIPKLSPKIKIAAPIAVNK